MPRRILPCQDNDPEMWFSEEYHSLVEAKRLCRGCPARDRCLQQATERREPCGVWGGELFSNGQVSTKKIRPPRTRRPRNEEPQPAVSDDASTAEQQPAA